MSNDLSSELLEHARSKCLGPSDILTQLISRYASHKAKDSAFADQRALMETITEIAVLRGVNKELRETITVLIAERDRQTEIIVTLRQELKEAKARNTMYLSKIQEHEAREY